MKKITFLLIGIFLFQYLISQDVPTMITYQGKLLENGSPVNETKEITFTIGTWSETHDVTINNGLYAVNLGEGIPIPLEIFENNSEVELQISIEGTDLSPHTDILSVPYAFIAKKAYEADNVFSGNYNDLENKPSIPTNVSDLTNDAGYITSPDDADADATNELQTLSVNDHELTISGGNSVTLTGGTDSQTLAVNNHTLSISNGNSVTLPDEINDADADPSNEIQTLSMNNYNLSISNGNSVTLPGLTLPYYNSHSGNDKVFVIDHSGTSQLMELQIENSNNSSDVLELRTLGSGSCLYVNNDGSDDGIYISNSSDTDDGIDINNNGDGHAIEIDNNGDNEAIYVRQYGTDDCGYFKIDNTSNTNDAIYASTNGTGLAGYFGGDIYVSGTIYESAISLKIDHPLDPENKYLYHSFVESPDMMNVYNGNVILDENGEAIVTLPDYFEALNMEYRYQLTCIGGFAQVYIAEEITNNQFKISGGKENIKISWQVTGIRKDPYAEKNRIIVEVEKLEKEKGLYLHYKEYNQPAEKSIEAEKSNN